MVEAEQRNPRDDFYRKLNTFKLSFLLVICTAFPCAGVTYLATSGQISPGVEETDAALTMIGPKDIFSVEFSSKQALEPGRIGRVPALIEESKPPVLEDQRVFSPNGSFYVERNEGDGWSLKSITGELIRFIDSAYPPPQWSRDNNHFLYTGRSQSGINYQVMLETLNGEQRIIDGAIRAFFMDGNNQELIAVVSKDESAQATANPDRFSIYGSLDADPIYTHHDSINYMHFHETNGERRVILEQIKNAPTVYWGYERLLFWFDPVSMEAIHVNPSHPFAVSEGFSPDGEAIVYVDLGNASGNHSVNVFDVNSGKTYSFGLSQSYGIITSSLNWGEAGDSLFVAFCKMASSAMDCATGDRLTQVAVVKFGKNSDGQNDYSQFQIGVLALDEVVGLLDDKRYTIANFNLK